MLKWVITGYYGPQKYLLKRLDWVIHIDTAQRARRLFKSIIINIFALSWIYAFLTDYWGGGIPNQSMEFLRA